MTVPVPTPLPARARAAVAALLLTFAGLATWGAWVKSETYDEPMYIFTAYSYVVTGDLSLNKEHPPLAKYLMGLPLLLLDVELPEHYQQKPGLPTSFISHQPRADHHLMLFLPRLPGIGLGVLLGLYVFAWARRAFGVRAGLASLSLYALNPNILGHARVAGNDFAITVFACITLYHVWCWLSAESDSRAAAAAATGALHTGRAWRHLGCAALALGCALGSKLTALLLLPVVGLVVLVAAVAWRRPALLGRALLALLAAFGLLYLMYGGEARSLGEARQHARFLSRGSDTRVFDNDLLEQGVPALFGEDTPVPMLSFLKGFDHQFAHGRAGHPTYFHGEIRNGGFGEFYVVGWLIKNPEALSLLLLLGLVAWRRVRPGWVHECCLWGFVGLQFALFSTADVQLGFKYVLPVVPLLCVAAGRVFADDEAPAAELRLGATLVFVAAVVAWLAFDDKGSPGLRGWVPLLVPLGYLVWTLGATRQRRWPGAPATQTRAPLALLLAWAALASLLRQPDDLMYFNEWVGGPENGWRWSVVGDDWGQDTAGLGRWMAARDLDHIYYDYYGTSDPEIWGVVSTPTHATPRSAMPVEGLVAVHVAALARFPQNYTWLQGLEPVDRIGNTIFVFDVTTAEANEKFFEAVREPLPPLGGH